MKKEQPVVKKLNCRFFNYTSDSKTKGKAVIDTIDLDRLKKLVTDKYDLGFSIDYIIKCVSLEGLKPLEAKHFTYKTIYDFVMANNKKVAGR